MQFSPRCLKCLSHCTPFASRLQVWLALSGVVGILSAVVLFQRKWILNYILGANWAHVCNTVNPLYFPNLFCARCWQTRRSFCANTQFFLKIRKRKKMTRDCCPSVVKLLIDYRSVSNAIYFSSIHRLSQSSSLSLLHFAQTATMYIKIDEFIINSMKNWHRFVSPPLLDTFLMYVWFVYKQV